MPSGDLSETSTDLLAALLAASSAKTMHWDKAEAQWIISPGLAGALGFKESWLAWGEAAWSDHVHGDQRLAVVGQIDNFLNAGIAPDFDAQLLGANGGWQWFRCQGKPLANHKILVLTDTTHARQERAALVDSQMRLRGLYDASPVAIVLWSREGRITDWNNMACKVFGYERDAVIGEKLMPLLISADDYALFADSISVATKKNEVGQVACRSLAKSGKTIISEWRTVALRGPKGILLGLQSMALDVTERVVAQEALSQAKEHAEALSQAKSEFLSLISHELRTPLNGILGFAQILEMTVAESEQEFVRPIVESGSNLLAIINGIVEYTEIDARPLDSSCESFLPAQSLLIFAERHEMRAKRKGLDFCWKISPAVAESVYGDQRSFEKIIDVLLENAVKFTETGKISIYLDMPESVAGQAILQVAVQDSGVGIADEYLPHIFTPFRQEENVIVRAQGGIGLGLALAKKLTDRLAGTLSVTSRKGQGSCFQLAIPCLLAQGK